jgi:hypothetical protein
MLGRAIEQNQKIGVDVMLIQNSAATLGRLVEQYYWKFIHEKAAIRGVKISESAKTGGRFVLQSTSTSMQLGEQPRVWCGKNVPRVRT